MTLQWAATKRQIVIYSLILLPLALLPCILGTAGLVYGLVALVMGCSFVALSLRVLREPDERASEQAAKQTFGFSILYLFVLFALLIIDRAPGLLPAALW